MEIILHPHTVGLIDDVDLPLLKPFKWYAQATDKNHSKYYAIAHLQGSFLYLHRLLLNPPKGVPVDHINGNGLDNRRKNLRICTSAGNNQNSRGWSKRHSLFIESHQIYKGVYRIKRASGLYGGRIWEARLCWGGKQRVIGIFDLPELAAMAYDDWARCFHGQYARLNFPQKGEMGVHDL